MQAGMTFPGPTTDRWRSRLSTPVSPVSQRETDSDAGSRQPWWATTFSVLKANVLALIAVIGAMLSSLLGWTATLALVILTAVAVPVLLILGCVAIAFLIQLVAIVLGGAG